jgi:hypothetical protein
VNPRASSGGGAWSNAPLLFRRHQGCAALFPRISLCFLL